MAKDLYKQTKQRLSRYEALQPAVIEEVAAFARTQDEFSSYQTFIAAMGVGEIRIHRMTDGQGVPYVDIPASKKEKGAVVVHIAMGNPLDEGQLYQVATLAGINPEFRIIAFGNPAGDRYYVKEHNVSLRKWWAIALGRSAKALVDPEIDYLQQQDITTCYQVGYSFGALKATIESQYLRPGQVKGLLLIDPVSKPRFITTLWRDFAKTYGPLGKYVNNADLTLYHQARGVAAKDRKFNRTFFRPIVIASALLIARTPIFALLRKVRGLHPLAKLVVAWGSASELVDDAQIQHDIRTTEEVVPLRFEGLEHAFANDVHLYAAIVRQFLLQK